MRSTTCVDCYFFRPLFDNADVGSCRAHPPQQDDGRTFVWPQGVSVQTIGDSRIEDVSELRRWPAVWTGDWCGEYRDSPE
jgi:hypothetical protein